MKKRLALTSDGRITECSSPPDKLGVGRCNHVEHQKEGQSVEDFLKEVESKSLNILKIQSGILDPLDERFETIKNSVPSSFYDENGILVLNGLLNDKARGVQSKGPLVLEENGDYYFKFLKSDEINLSTGLHFLDMLDYHHSSISEDLGSSLLSSINNLGDFDYVSYSFEVINDNGNETTGVLSRNFLYNSEGDSLYEKFLSIEDSKKTIADDVRVKHDEFVENVIDSRDNQKILEKMVEYYSRYGVEEEKAKDFILKQAAFDLLTCNYDRKPNATNSVFVKNNNTGVTSPINLDYGRCYVLEVGFESYDLIKNYKLDPSETMEDVISESVETYMEKYFGEGSIFSQGSSKSKVKDTVDFLLDNGFQPFELDVKKLEECKSNLKNKVNKYKNGDLNLFVDMKISMMDQVLNDENMRKLWRGI